MSDCDNNCNCQSKSSGFIFGLVLGAILGAIIAIVIYKNNKTKIFSDLKEKLENLFGGFFESKKKEKSNFSTTPNITKKIKKPKTFIKPKKRI